MSGRSATSKVRAVRLSVARSGIRTHTAQIAHATAINLESTITV